MMTRQDFESIATVLNANTADMSLVEDFADMLREDNPRFNRALFVRAATENLRKRMAHEVHMLDTSLSFPY